MRYVRLVMPTGKEYIAKSDNDLEACKVLVSVHAPGWKLKIRVLDIDGNYLATYEVDDAG